MDMKKKLLAMIAAAVLAAGSAFAADYPNKQITLLVPYKAGGATDTIMRVFDKYAKDVFGHSFGFKYVPGAMGRKGMKVLSKSLGDGYTIAGYNFPNIVIEDIVNAGGYKLKDFRFIARTIADPHGLVTKKDSKIKTLDDFVKAAKTAPGKLTVSIPAKFDGSEIALYMVLEKLGVKITVVPFKGGARQKAGILGGHVDAGMVNFSNVSTILDELNVLGITSSSRLPGLDIKTFKEQGTDVVHYESRIMMTPAGVSDKRLATLEKGIKAIYDNPSFKADMKKRRQPLAWMSGKDLEKYLASQMGTYKALAAKYLKKK